MSGHIFRGREDFKIFGKLLVIPFLFAFFVKTLMT